MRPVRTSAGTGTVCSDVSASGAPLARRSPRTAAGVAPHTSATQTAKDAKRFGKRTKACRDLNSAASEPSRELHLARVRRHDVRPAAATVW